MEYNNNNDDSSSGLSFYHEDSSEDDNISYEEEIRPPTRMNDDFGIDVVNVDMGSSKNSSDAIKDTADDTATATATAAVTAGINKATIGNDNRYDIISHDKILLQKQNEQDHQQQWHQQQNENSAKPITILSSTQQAMIQNNSSTPTLTCHDQISTSPDDIDFDSNTATNCNNTTFIASTTTGLVQLQQQQQQQQQQPPPLTTIIQNEEEQERIKLKQLQQKRTNLLSKLNQIQKDQSQSQKDIQQIQISIQTKLSYYNTLSHQKRKQSLCHYSSIVKQRQYIESEYEKLNKIHVLHDVFYIFYRGFFATINGLRLGMSAPIKQYHNSHHNHSNSSEQDHVYGTIDVPWHEINAGIGMIALLISTIRSKLHIRSRFEILPRGSTTKICINNKKNNYQNNNMNGHHEESGSSISSSSSSGYNHHQEWDLHYQPTTFSFFARRHWNNALNILGYCLYEIVEEVKQRLEFYKINSGSGSTTSIAKNDKSAPTTSTKNNDNSINTNDSIQIIIPYDVELSGDWKGERSIGYVKIGGMDIGFNGDGIAWTKALRYVALDLKWLIAFVSKYIDC